MVSIMVAHPVNIINNTGTAISNYQQMITAPICNNCMNASISNVMWAYDPAGASIIPSWLEGQVGSTVAPTNANSGSLIYWLNIAGTISAGATQTVYMIFADRGTTVWDGTLTGVAPQWTSTYGQYDNGASIFNNYWNFAGTSLPSGWTTTSYFTGSVNNGVTITSSSGWAGITQSSAFSYSNVIIDAYAKETLHQAFLISLSQAEAYGGSSWQIANGYDFDLDGGGTGGQGIVKLVSSSETGLVSSTFNLVLGTYYILSDYFASPNLKETVNYNNATLSTSDSTFSSLQYLSLTVWAGANWTVNWLRIRAYPPNGVMPAVLF